MNRLPFLILAFVALAVSTGTTASSEYNAWHSEASELYAKGDYAKAYKQYIKLGKKGDRLSQYRASYMTLKGLGTKADVIESLAWATLAAHNGPEGFSEYQDTVAALVPEDKRKKANQKVGYFMRRWGDIEEEQDQEHLGHCTGSRLAARCNPDDSRKIWVSWSREVQQEQDLLLQIEELNQSIENNLIDTRFNETGG